MLRVDLEALRRGELLPGEVSEVAGVGPISIQDAAGMLSDSNLKVLWHRRSQVEAVTTVGRTIPASVRAALLERDRACVVSGCGENRHLEIDHVVPFAAGGPSSLENLVRLCRHHHKLKTYKGFKLQKDGTRWKLLAPHPALAP